MLKSRQMTQIRTRFAPSPTGSLHIGGLRTALYSYAFAKSGKGKFILRIEDTDRNRFVSGAVEGIYEMLKKFGLGWDEGPLVGGPHTPYIQSERKKKGIYKKYAEQLIDEGQAYYCFCSLETKEEIEEKHQKSQIQMRDDCRFLSKKEAEDKIKAGKKAAIRLRVPDDGEISYFDFVLKKEVSWQLENVDEVVLLKSDSFPTYHLAVVIDDFLMKISHIIRGRDWLPSTPVHLLLFKYLKFPLPKIGHLTDILDPAGGKLSKRKGSVTCEEFLADGYLPEAILNFIMLLGWGPKDDSEFFTLEQFVAGFLKGNLHVANPVFNRKKLNWFNGMYLRKKTDKELFQLLKPFAPKEMGEDLIKKTVGLVKERINKLSEYEGMVGFLVKEPKVDKKFLLEKAREDDGLVKEQLKLALELISRIETWETENLEKKFRDLAEKKGYHLGKFFMVIRVVLTGSNITPPLFASMAILGMKKTRERLKKVFF